MFKKENLRKNFLRVKQIADQNLGRAEKSEVLSEDQQDSEKRVEVIRQITNNLIKKVTALLEAPPGTDVEKRLKKLPETSLSHALIEASTLLGTDTLLGTVCQQCGECESVIAKEELQCELDIEKDVLTHLQYLAEIEIPTILKLRKQLTKSTLDMDSAKSRFNAAVRQSHVPGANMAAAAAKADSLREEHDEAVNRVESIKDNLSIELFNFLAKESEHSTRLLALLESQAAYHKKALRCIEEVIPKMKQTIEESPMKPVFAMPLEEHLQKMGRDISLVLEACIITLLVTGMEEEGLFRIAGSAIKLKKLRACFDAQAVDMEDFSTDPHTVAGVLKQYLRELPEPLLTFDLYNEFMRTVQLPSDQRLQALKNAVNKLPPANYNNIRYLIKFLFLLAEKSSVNKMTPSNIAIVMGPNLLWAKGETAPNMMTAGAVSAIVEALIIHAEDFFPGELDFHLTGRGCAPPSPSVSANSTTIAPPVVTVTSAKDDTQVQVDKHGDPRSKAQKEKESTLVQIATGEARISSSALHEPGMIDLKQEKDLAVDVQPSTAEEGMQEDVWVRIEAAGEKCLEPLAEGGGFLPAQTRHTNPSVSSSRQRPTMPVPTPPGSLPSAATKGSSSLHSSFPPKNTSSAPMLSPATVPDKSVHSDMYSTVFALHSLGDGGGAGWSDYLTRVRAVLDGHFQSSTSPSSSSFVPPGLPSGGRGWAGSRAPPSMQGLLERPSPSAFPPRPPAKCSSQPELWMASERGRALAVQRDAMKWCQGSGTRPKGSQEVDFQTPESLNQEHYLEPVQASVSTSSPAVMPYSPTSVTSPASLYPNISTIVSNTSAHPESQCSSGDSPEGSGGQISPKFPRRVVKKPAPPPPPERSYNVAVTASVAKTSSGNSAYSTMPRHSSQHHYAQSALPDPVPEVPPQPGAGDWQHHSPPERRPSGTERSFWHPPDRPHAPPPERPRIPPGSVSVLPQPPGTPGHQRSASTGAMYVPATPTTASAPSPGSSSEESLQAMALGAALTTGQGNNYPSGSLTLGRHSSMRPRPNPPPPPPPFNQKSEETHL